ncbi:hypothetical protein BESB_058450 [Besnoitia besnoiti]|uniref:P21-carboxy-terminal region-binding protein n=1 Tax=Besnoitia besnoiti TaxID=94643 RepID=A0A2A9M8Z6_BESBE|nr:hypothetical protein BESB_058450 [Besnoitia besnoiti]PFH34958.1 hypothetical protein BESB_058450 [Besnoitia besnoiti]
MKKDGKEASACEEAVAEDKMEESLEGDRRRKRGEEANCDEAPFESESSGDEDDGDEIQLIARTKEELLRQGEDDEDEDDEDITETVQASFGLFDPHEEATDAVLSLLRQSRLDTHLKTPSRDLHALAETIANQGNVGSLLKAVEDEEGEQGEANERNAEDASAVVGFLSLLSLRQYPEATNVFRDAFLRLAGEHASADVKAKLEAILKPSEESAAGSANTNCGWLVKERLSNTPPALVPSMFSSLLEDIAWSLTTEEMEEEERPFYNYTHVAVLTKVYKEADASAAATASKKAKGDEPLGFKPFFPHPEDEELLKAATAFFTYPTGSSVRVAPVPDQANSRDSREGKSQSEKREDDAAASGSQVRACPEYLLFFVMPFEKLSKCTKAIERQASLQVSS